MKAADALRALALMVLVVGCLVSEVVPVVAPQVAPGVAPVVAPQVAPAAASGVEIPPRIDDLTCASFSPTGSEASGWHHLDGQIGDVVAGPGVSLAAAARARATLDRGAASLVQAFGSRAVSGNRLSVCLVSERQSIAAVPGMNADPSVAGAAITGARLAIVAVDTTSGDLDRIVLHEAAHLLASERARAEGERALPMWLSEGLAELAASEILETTNGLHRAAAKLKARQALPSVRELQTGLSEGASPDEIQQFYAASASAVAHLVSARGWNRIWEMLRITGKLPADLEVSWHARLEAVS